MSLETEARGAWLRWGSNFALWTHCSACHRLRYCRGKRRETVRCLECFDLGRQARLS